MTKTHTSSAMTFARAYETPRLQVVGDARDVVLGEVGGGWDYLSMTSPLFEFEPDETLPGLD